MKRPGVVILPPPLDETLQVTNQHLLLSAIIIGWRDVLGELTNLTHEHDTGLPRFSYIIKSKYNNKAEDN